ncbi:hypothetical protein BDW62DRAFT_195381 [Aspergillus aurantiobrunneus]
MQFLTPELKYGNEDDYKMALTTARLEKVYDQVHAHTVQMLDAERGRVHCMEQLFLRIENESLQLQIHKTGNELIQVREAESDVRLQLDGAMRELDHLQDVAQTSSREMENLRRELASLNAVASDSQTLQADKVRLSKEVSSIQSEVEKLRSQNTSSSTILAEKQAVTRQLNALEVQLENEKRAHERALAKQSQQTEEVAALTMKLEEARRELELERRHKQDTSQQNDRAPVVHQSPVAGNAKATNEALVAAKDRQREDTPAQQEDLSGTTTKVLIQRPSETRPPKLTTRLHPELTIVTPGAVRARDQQKRFSTLPGDKSSFSITPFLNRTTGFEESSMSSDDELIETNEQKSPAVKESHNSGKAGPTKVVLDGDTRNKQKQKILSPDKVGDYQVPLTRPAEQKQPLAKKRKLGLQRDRSLFDQDEDDKALQDTRKPGRKLVGTGHTSLIGNRAFTQPMGFSPLKRDRKRF